VGLGLLKTTPPSGTVKGDIFPVSNTDVVEIFFKPGQIISILIFQTRKLTQVSEINK
jgi:hypothetical protein